MAWIEQDTLIAINMYYNILKITTWEAIIMVIVALEYNAQEAQKQAEDVMEVAKSFSNGKE